ncbi:sigma-70 family RNA polymerase sigma factor [Luteimonas aestuarii]|uniref:Sigma-70 family RNA polymerase sigma factor n=1 Tax=Luteimonas aestuarii TaxID=453837 RepID=A0A4R5U4G6_9GAMM|nr:ECF-type sigma factor [Luteimonas aestuarii]TDK28652.1 sigma-70 family RNA polymerase sigma factor [Luteimonas aestuarii]
MTTNSAYPGPAKAGLQDPVGADAVESVTQLLVDAESGNDAAWNRIYALVYHDLHRIARTQIRLHYQPGLSPSSLISEAWIKLARTQASVSCRPHLMSLVARAMRFVLLDEARRAMTGKRGGEVHVEHLSTMDDLRVDSQIEELLALDKALEALSRVDERLMRVVELRYFGGLDEGEIATLLGVTERTIRRDWRKARAYLQSHLDTADNG